MGFCICRCNCMNSFRGFFNEKHVHKNQYSYFVYNTSIICIRLRINQIRLRRVWKIHKWWNLSCNVHLLFCSEVCKHNFPTFFNCYCTHIHNVRLYISNINSFSLQLNSPFHPLQKQHVRQCKWTYSIEDFCSLTSTIEKASVFTWCFYCLWTRTHQPLNNNVAFITTPSKFCQ